MLDLHLFLGRRLENVFNATDSTPILRSAGDGKSSDDVVGVGTPTATKVAPAGYDLSSLNPDLVHYGNFPQQVPNDCESALRRSTTVAWERWGLIWIARRDVGRRMSPGGEAAGRPR